MTAKSRNLIFVSALVLTVGVVCYAIGRAGRSVGGDVPSSERKERPVKEVVSAKVVKPVSNGGEVGTKEQEADQVMDVNGRALAVKDDPNAERSFQAREDVRQFVLEEFAKLTAEGSGKADGKVFARIRELGDRNALAALTAMIRHGEVDEKMAALTALAAAYGSGSEESGNKAGPEGDVGADSTEASLEAEAALTHDIVQAVQDGLGDSSEEVRNAAYEATMMLKDEEWGILTMQLLSEGGDAKLARMLVTDTSGTKNEDDLKISMSALGCGDKEAAAAAAANLRQQLGQNFENTEEALEWWEANRLSVLKDVVTHDPADAVTIESEDPVAEPDSEAKPSAADGQK